jgi:phage FluMu protein Com
MSPFLNAAQRAQKKKAKPQVAEVNNHIIRVKHATLNRKSIKGATRSR